MFGLLLGFQPVNRLAGCDVERMIIRVKMAKAVFECFLKSIYLFGCVRPLLPCMDSLVLVHRLSCSMVLWGLSSPTRD